MHERQLTAWLQRTLPIGVAVVLLLMPFHATLTVWLSQLVGRYTALRLWKEALLVPLLAGAVWICCRRPAVRRILISARLPWLIGCYLAVQAVWGFGSLVMHRVSLMALGYGIISDCRYLVFLMAVWVIALRAPILRERWGRLVFWPAAAVIVFGLLQYFVLPYDFLRHFGYSAATIFPYEDVNHNIHYIRIMSSLRGANPLGAYLVVVISLAGAVWTGSRRWRYAVLGLASVAALGLTYSRGAWLGAAVSLAACAWLVLPALRRRWAVLAGAAAIVFASGMVAVALHDNATFQNIVFHTQADSAIKTTSDQGHAAGLASGVHDVLSEPLGRGPGTAGPASVYNVPHRERIAENYFIQIGQETGWVGLLLFGAILVYLGWMLWRGRQDPLALGLFVSLLGISVVCLFGHAWADDTLAYLWWGLAGIALARPAHRSAERVE